MKKATNSVKAFFLLSSKLLLLKGKNEVFFKNLFFLTNRFEIFVKNNFCMPQRCNRGDNGRESIERREMG